ncbi:MAG: hypothetical protein WA130_04275 [Candidatus Methanoperedens sp.]
MPLIMGTISMDQMVNMFVVGEEIWRNEESQYPNPGFFHPGLL